MTALANRTCSICGQTLEARDPKGYGIALKEHTRTVHPELFRWQRRMRKIALLTLLIAIILGSSAIHLPTEPRDLGTPDLDRSFCCTHPRSSSRGRFHHEKVPEEVEERSRNNAFLNRQHDPRPQFAVFVP